MSDDGRVPPQDLDAERSVLGALLLDDRVAEEVFLECRQGDFYSDANRTIYGCIHEMTVDGKTAIDIRTLKRELERRGELEQVGGQAYLAQLVESVPFTDHATYYAKIVHDKWLLRRVVEVCGSALADAFGSVGEPTETLAKIEEQMFSISDESGGHRARDMADVVSLTFDRIFDRMNGNADEWSVMTGLHGLDALLGGLRGGELVVLAARPAMGKTALMCNVILSAATNGTGSLVVSLEQSSIELGERLLSIHAGINSQNMRDGSISDADAHAIMGHAEELKKLPIVFDDHADQTVADILANARRMARRSNLGLIVIDYLQLVEPDDPRAIREQQIARMTRKLKGVAKKLNVPVVVLAQLNRGIESREDKRPRMSDLRESGAIEQDADSILFLHRPEAYDPDDRRGEADLIVAKNRAGPIGTVPLVWQPHLFRFADRAAASASALADSLGYDDVRY